MISSTGEVAGEQQSASTASQVAYLAKPGLTIILQSLDSAPVTPHGINAEGDVVGADGPHSFLWKDGVMQNLNTLAPPAETGWTIQIAEAINDVGQIAAWGSDAAFNPHFLLLTPVSGT